MGLTSPFRDGNGKNQINRYKPILEVKILHPINLYSSVLTKKHRTYNNPQLAKKQYKYSISFIQAKN